MSEAIESSWVLSTVGVQFEVQLGKMLDAARNTGEPKPYLGNRAVQWDKIDISAAGLVPMTRTDLQRYRLREGDLLVCEGGEVGRAAIWRGELPECYFQKALHRLRPRSGYNVQLMLAFLEYWASVGKFSNFVTQTSIAHLPREKFVQMPLPVPEASEQKRLSDLLDDVHGETATLERLIAKKQAIKQGMMQQLLTGRVRLPGFAGEWADSTIGAITEQHRRALDPRRYPARLFQHFSLPAFDDGRRPRVESGSDIDSIKFIVPDQAVLVSKLNPRIPRVWAPELIGVNAIGSTEFVVLTAYDNVDRSFLKWTLTSDTITNRMKLLATGTTGSHARIHPRQVASLAIAVPSLPEQQAIARTLDDAHAEIDALCDRLDKARDIKIGMMQQLLTGRSRLPVQEATG